MKVSITSKMLFVLFFSLGLFVFGQKLVKQEDLSLKVLKNLVEDAGFKVEETGEDYIKIRNTFTWNIYADQSKGYLTFSGIYPASDKATSLKAYELCNIINQEVAVIKIDYETSSKTFGISYYFMVEGGFTTQSFVKAINLFRDTIEYSLDKDEEGLIK